MSRLPHALRALAALGSAGPSPNGGNGVIRGTTRRQPASNAAKTPPQPASCATSPTRPGRRADWRDNVATLKPPTPLLTPNKGPLKPPSPLHPKTAPNTTISHPQRRWRFQATGPTGVKGAGGAAGPGCGAHGQQRHYRLPNFARNLSWSFFETPQKRCNSNDANSMFEQAAGELRAKLMGEAEAGPGRGAGGRRQGQGGPRDRPLRAAGSRVAISRAGRRPPAHTAAGPHKAARPHRRDLRRPKHPWDHKQHEKTG